MRRLDLLRLRSGFRADTSRFASARVLPLVDFSVILAFGIDLLAEFFVWKGYLPEDVTSLPQILLVAAVAFAYTRMLILDRIPGAVIAIVGVSLVGITVAISRGQGIGSTMWGWWNTFKFPLLGLYAYLRMEWPGNFSQRLLRFCVAIVVFEMLFQIVQYLSGQEIGDNLSGTFGWHGVLHLQFFTLFAVALALGRWVANKDWKPILVVLAAGSISNVLAENKFFPVGAVSMALLAVVFFLGRGGQVRRLLFFVALLGLGISAFFVAYNTLAPAAQRGKPLERIFVDEEARTNYLNKIKRSNTQDRVTYNMGRNTAAAYALSSISDDAVTLLFGYGIGARRESQALQTVGSRLKQDNFARGTNLASILQESGLFGILVLLGFVLWAAVRLYRDIRRYPKSEALQLRYALLLFVLLWPLYIWYSRPLDSTVAMMLFWISLGYVLSDAQGHHQHLWITRPSTLPVPSGEVR
jgi:hypothetical protein